MDLKIRGNSRKQNITRYQGRWRKFKEAFIDLIEYQADEIDKAPEDEQIQKSGINILIKNKGKDHDKYVKIFLNSLKDITAAIRKEGFGKVLKDFYIELNFDVASEPKIYSRYGDLIGGAYDPNNDKLYMFLLGITDKISDSTLIHELAHRYWFKYVPERAKKAWKEKFEQKRIRVANTHIKKFFDMFFDEKRGFPYKKELKQKIEKIDDPTMKILFKYFAENTPIFEPKDGKSRYEAYWDFFQYRARGEEIPLEWITDYARSNEKEAFAEAFKLWVGGVKGKLGPWTRAFFKEIVSTGGVNIKEEEKNSIIDKYLKESPKMGVIFGQGPDIRSTSKTEFSKDYLLSKERNLIPKNSSGFVNTLANYYDPLDPKHKKIFRKPNLSISYITMDRRKIYEI